jgi:hypothetical protein
MRLTKACRFHSCCLWGLYGEIYVLRAACCIVAAFGVTSVANAQVADSLDDLQASLHGGERLTITDQAGVVTKGRLIALSDQSIRLMVQPAGPTDLSASSLAKIERVRSGVRKGTLVGLMTGAVTGALAVALTPCDRSCVGPSKEAVMLPAAAIFGGIGAGIGAIIGAARPGHRLIYLAPGSTADRVQPLLCPGI